MPEVCDILLVAREAAPPLSLERWPSVQKVLLEGQPARSAFLQGDPPRAISIESCGGAEVAPALLVRVEQLTGTALRVEPVSLRGLGAGFRDQGQRSQVAALIRDRLADDRDQDECRYLLRFCWQLSMPDGLLGSVTESGDQVGRLMLTLGWAAQRICPKGWRVWCAADCAIELLQVVRRQQFQDAIGRSEYKKWVVVLVPIRIPGCDDPLPPAGSDFPGTDGIARWHLPGLSGTRGSGQPCSRQLRP